MLSFPCVSFRLRGKSMESLWAIVHFWINNMSHSYVLETTRMQSSELCFWWMIQFMVFDDDWWFYKHSEILVKTWQEQHLQSLHTPHFQTYRFRMFYVLQHCMFYVCQKHTFGFGSILSLRTCSFGVVSEHLLFIWQFSLDSKTWRLHWSQQQLIVCHGNPCFLCNVHV